MNEFYKFFDFTLNPATRRLQIQNEEVVVSSKAFDVLLYKEISLVIADKLKLQISRIDESNLSQSQTNDAEAYQFYLKGKYILDNFQSGEDYQESLYSALNFFQQALKRDSNYAPAYVGSGRVYFMLFNDNFLSFAEARQKCQTALQLAFDADRHLSDTFALQGMIQIYFERNWQEAKKSLAHAVRFGNLLWQPVLAGSI